MKKPFRPQSNLRAELFRGPAPSGFSEGGGGRGGGGGGRDREERGPGEAGDAGCRRQAQDPGGPRLQAEAEPKPAPPDLPGLWAPGTERMNDRKRSCGSLSP